MTRDLLWGVVRYGGGINTGTRAETNISRSNERALSEFRVLQITGPPILILRLVKQTQSGRNSKFDPLAPIGYPEIQWIGFKRRCLRTKPTAIAARRARHTLAGLRPSKKYRIIRSR